MAAPHSGAGPSPPPPPLLLPLRSR
uniref:Uncharacterized protein n=1 Tax=Arundo donax TaxID=35708 RepID=A0A0A9EV68_ARUDO